MVKSFLHNSLARFVLISTLILSCLTGHTQFIDLSLQTKFYPAGSIYGLRAERKVDSKNSLSLMVAYNILYHRDLGVHQDERGGAPEYL